MQTGSSKEFAPTYQTTQYHLLEDTDVDTAVRILNLVTALFIELRIMTVIKVNGIYNFIH